VAKNSPCPSIEIRSGLEPGADTSDKYSRCVPDDNCVKLGYDPSLPTNRNLIAFLEQHFDLKLRKIFATNLFPFIKSGGMGSDIPFPDLLWAAQEFALPQIRIVRPKLVVCLGLRTFNALRQACDDDLPRVSPLARAIASPFTFEGARVWCQAHTGGPRVGDAQRPQNKSDW
jgi:hypothetical protein